jgi:hypothetical protein
LLRHWYQDAGAATNAPHASMQAHASIIFRVVPNMMNFLQKWLSGTDYTRLHSGIAQRRWFGAVLEKGRTGEPGNEKAAHW